MWNHSGHPAQSQSVGAALRQRPTYRRAHADAQRLELQASLKFCRQCLRNLLLMERPSPREKGHRSKFARTPPKVIGRGKSSTAEIRLYAVHGINTYRCHTRNPADRRAAFPGYRDSGQPRRQGKEARHPGFEVRRRMTGRCALARIPRGHMNGSFLIKTRVALWRR